MIDERFNFFYILDIGNPKLIETLPLMLYFTIPGMEPRFCQRIMMGKNIQQVKNTYIISSFLLLIILFFIEWISFLLFNANPNLDPDQLLKHITDNYSYPGFKGLLIIGVIAMTMSSADSAINSSSVLFANDFCKPLNIGKNYELIIAKVCAVFIGCLGILLALKAKNLLFIILSTQSFYMPVVTVPIMMTIMGFKSTIISVLTGMGTGFITVLS